MFSIEELTRLRALAARPEEREAYAEWLAERGDPRALWVRLAPDAEDIRYVAWLERDGHREYYVEQFPTLARAFEAWDASRDERTTRSTLQSALDPGWVAWMSTVARPFEPFFFFDNHGNEREIEASELPFSEVLGTRGAVVTFASELREPTVDPGLLQDLAVLHGLPPAECARGAATCPLHPFVTALEDDEPLTGARVLRALRADRFASKYVGDLDRTHLPYPGYHPGFGQGVENDEVHDDGSAQYVFETDDADDEEEDDADDEVRSEGAHEVLKRNVVNGQLWYVLLHTTPRPSEPPAGMPRELAASLGSHSRYVILFAVGRSLRGRRLIGVVTHQMCQNLCD